MSGRWQDDQAFVDWLTSAEYAGLTAGKLQIWVSLGSVLYMHEAWLASRASS